jgi:CHAT domain-containing protein
VDRDEASGRKLNHLLGFDSFDIIHYAGHASFDESKPDLSGLVMKDGIPFFAQKIRRILAGRPLVFLNACETGRTANEATPEDAQRSVGRYLGGPAEGLTSAFVYGGAMACIGAQWPVFDDSAADFALTFYDSMIEGNFVGEAMRRARQMTKDRFPDEISWASFVLYGDPTFRLGGSTARA